MEFALFLRSKSVGTHKVQLNVYGITTKRLSIFMDGILESRDCPDYGGLSCAGGFLRSLRIQELDLFLSAQITARFIITNVAGWGLVYYQELTSTGWKVAEHNKRFFVGIRCNLRPLSCS